MERKDYSKPVLVTFGAMTQLTQGLQYGSRPVKIVEEA